MSEETVKEKLIDEIEGLDWYHVNPKGELVHGSNSEYESYWKCTDVMSVIERVLRDGDKSGPSDKWVSVDEPPIARPLEEWHEDFGDVLWWKFPIEEPPYVGSPLDLGWPGYHTHWTPLPPLPAPPKGVQ